MSVCHRDAERPIHFVPMKTALGRALCAPIVEAYCLPARCHGNALTLAAEMLRSQLTTVAPRFVRKLLKLSPRRVTGLDAGLLRVSARAAFVRDLLCASRVFVRASLPRPRLFSSPNTGDGTNIQVFLRRERGVAAIRFWVQNADFVGFSRVQWEGVFTNRLGGWGGCVRA